MRKTAALLGAVLLASSLTGPALGSAKSREVTKAYTMGSGAFMGHGEVHWTLGSQYQKFAADRGEQWVSFEIADNFGEPVRGHVHIDLDGDGKLDDQMDFCGSTSKPIAVKAGSIVEVGTIFGLCDDTSPSIVTEGTITATFTK